MAGTSPAMTKGASGATVGATRGPEASCPYTVMPGLVPGISIGAIAAAEMDGRNKSGHDEGGGVRGGDRRAPGGGRGPLAMCHELSCFVMRAAGNVMVCHGPPALSPSFACEGGPGREGRFRVPVRIPHAVPLSCSVPLRSRRRRLPASGPCFARIAWAPARGRGRAYRAGAVRAPDCPRARQTQGAPLPSVPLGSFSHRRETKRPRGSRLLLLA